VKPKDLQKEKEAVSQMPLREPDLFFTSDALIAWNRFNSSKA
jgi:hypothetical protein